MYQRELHTSLYHHHHGVSVAASGVRAIGADGSRDKMVIAIREHTWMRPHATLNRARPDRAREALCLWDASAVVRVMRDAFSRSPMPLVISSSAAVLLLLWLRRRYLAASQRAEGALQEFTAAVAKAREHAVSSAPLDAEAKRRHVAATPLTDAVLDNAAAPSSLDAGTVADANVRHLQAALRGWFCRHLLGPRAQGVASQGGRRGTNIRVCGANTCCTRGADDVFESLEDLIPPGDVQIGRTACFAQCGLGPNVSVTCGGHAARTHRGIDTPEATCRLLRATGVRVPRALQQASKLREEAQRAAADADYSTSEALAASALRVLAARRVLGGSVSALRLRHKLLLLQATAAREQAEEGEAAAATWLACAREARMVQERLHRAHSCGPRAEAGLSTPRLLPALLLEAQALVHQHQHASEPSLVVPGAPARAAKQAEPSAECGPRAAVAAEARELLHRLERSPHEPPRTRAHRVRASERREAQRLLRALDGTLHVPSDMHTTPR